MRNLWNRLPLALKMALPMALLSFISAFTIVAVTQYNQQQLLHERTDKLGDALASRLAASAARPLVQSDAVSLQAALAGFAEEPVVQRAVVFNVQEQLVAAAGDELPDTLDYSATIHWQDSVIGRTVLSLKPIATTAHYPQLGDLLMLTLILTAISAGVGVMLGNRAESLLVNLTRRLSGEQVDFNYEGTDALARVLDTPPPPLLKPEPITTDRGEFILQLVIPNESEDSGARALQLATAVTNVYGGKVELTRAGGITARFPATNEQEGPFRAVCCAELLIQLSANTDYRVALAALASSDIGNAWQEQQLIERLHQAAATANSDCRLQIDGQLQRHPTIQERCTLAETPNNFWQVIALLAPYDTLLARQIHTLREQLPGIA
ncbi:MAG: hypothetical protein JWM78_3834 [Verrucomicrobiaceae bacterium]|nr:hypothetical protein [Verrucomicrobiaceae bacterium]